MSLDTLFRPYAIKNLRQRYSGLVVVMPVRAAVGTEFVVILRLSRWKQQDYAARLAHTPDEMASWLSPLVDAGVDAFHCSQRALLADPQWAKKVRQGRSDELADVDAGALTSLS